LNVMQEPPEGGVAGMPVHTNVGPGAAASVAAASTVAASTAPASLLVEPVVQSPPPHPVGVSVKSQKPPVPQSAFVQQYCTHSPVVLLAAVWTHVRPGAQKVLELSQDPHRATELPGPVMHP
jgi:hypothetical protein